MTHSIAPGLPAAMLPALLDLLPTGVVYYHPVYDMAGQVVDFSFTYVNAAAQRLLGLPAQPTTTYREQWSSSIESGALAFHRDTFLTGTPAPLRPLYPAKAHGGFLQASVARVEEGLLVSFPEGHELSHTLEEAARSAQSTGELRPPAVTTPPLGWVQAPYELLARTLGQVPAAVATLHGPEHRFAYLNDAYQALTDGRAAMGRTVAEALPEVVGQGFTDLLDRVYATGQSYQAEETTVWLQDAATGQPAPHYQNFTYQPLLDPSGQVTGILVFAVEVTAQVLARQQMQELHEALTTRNEKLRASHGECLQTNAALSELQQQQQQLNQELEARVAARTQEAWQQRGRLEQLVMTAPIAICVFDGPDWVYQLVNPRYQQMFPGRPLLGLRLVDALPELADQPLMNILRHVYDTGILFESKEVLVPLARTAEGPVEDLYFDLTYQARYDEAGRIDGFITFAADATEQVRARRQREAQQQQLRDLLEQAPVAMAIFRGPQHLIELANARHLTLWDRTADQVLGRPLFEALPEVAGHGYEEFLAEVLATGQPYEAHEQSVPLRRNGVEAPAYFDFIYQPLRDSDGHITRVVEVATELTGQVLARQRVEEQERETHLLNEELLRSNRQLTRTNADLDNFVYTASHDLKVPISNIEGLLRLLEELLPAELRTPDTLQPVLSRMQEAVERFTVTIGHLTEVSKLQLEFDQPVTIAALAPLIESVRQDLQPLLAETGGQLHVDIRECPALVISEKALRSILYNLLSNAFKYRHPERAPMVHLSCQPEGERHLLRVQDNGLGLSPEQQGKLFQLFQRLHTHVEGTGMGLYMVKKMVENAGGALLVHSTVGKGTIFEASFPC